MCLTKHTHFNKHKAKNFAVGLNSTKSANDQEQHLPLGLQRKDTILGKQCLKKKKKEEIEINKNNYVM